MPRTALFCIDMQAEMAQDPQTEVPHAARIRDVVNTILSKARTAINDRRAQGVDPDLSIIIVQHYETAEGETLLKGSKAWELVFKPENETESIVEKTEGDTFESNQQLADELKAQGIEQVVIFGLRSECCVAVTCEGALAAGFNVCLLQGAHSTYDDGEQKAVEIEREVEETLRERGVKVIPWEEWQP